MIASIVAAVVVIAGVAAGAGLLLRRRQRLLRHFTDRRLAERILGRAAARPPVARLVLALAGAAALGIALLQPATAERRDSPGGRSVVLVIDVSTSMLVNDQHPTRLAWTRAAAGLLVDALGDVPAGIVVFAGRAYALVPPTLDPAAVHLYLDALDPGMVTQTGSALSAAVRQGVGLLHAGGEGGALVVFSDGNVAEPEDSVEAAIALARRTGVPVMTVGVGTPQGGAVPALDPLSGAVSGVLREEDGGEVRSQLTEQVLRRVAAQTGGAYVHASVFEPAELAAAARRAAGAEEGGRGGLVALLTFIALLLLVTESALAGAPARRGGILALLFMVWGGCDAEGGDEHGDAPADSVAMYRELASARPGDPVPLYDLGTVLLTRGRFGEARPPLSRAADPPSGTDPEVVRRARFNLGNTVLEPLHAAAPAAARAEREQRAEALRAAAQDYRAVLRLTPGDVDAKWNLELTLRRLDEERVPPPEEPSPPEPDGPGGGGGAGGGGGGGGSESAAANQNPQPQAGAGGGDRPSMSPEEAESLLSEAREREVGAQRDALRKPQPQGVIAH